jgi:riboflavin kinase/FMN adenylyltransferase
MEIINLRTMAKEEIIDNTIVALGTFDGCHMAHKAVLASAFYEARKKGIKSLAYIFDTIPNKQENGAIYTLQERIKAIKNIGIDYIAIDTFERVKGLLPREFYDKVLKGQLNALGAACGYNYRFGKGASSGGDELHRLFSENDGGSVVICDKIMVKEKPVSSTLAREYIKNGEVEDLFALGTNYSVYSRVEEGKHLATKMGLPTINQYFPEGKLIPKHGVYITECEIGEDVYPAITNVGVRPTTDECGRVNMETHIIGYKGYLYGSYIRVNFYKYLREEKRFDGKEALFEQIALDKKTAFEYFK